MPDLTISDATRLTGADSASGDLFPVVDVSASTGSKGRSITRDELGSAMVKTPAVTSAISASIALKPKIIFVDATNGNDSTAVVGDPTKPYQSLGTAYAIGVATASNFELSLSANATQYTLTLNADLSPYCLGMRGAGVRLTSVLLNAMGSPVENADGSDAFDGHGGFTINDLTVIIAASGGASTGTNPGTYKGGNGGNWVFHGNAFISGECNGGSAATSDMENCIMTGGDGGIIRLSGGLVTNALMTNYGGSSDGTAGTVGPLYGDGCDLRLFVSSSTDITFGRCSYSSSYIPSISNDRGGNAAY